MDEIKRLEREISALQEQLRRQTAEASRARQSMIDETRRKLDETQREWQRALREHDRAAQAEYEKLLGQYQQSVNADLNTALTGMNADYSRLLADVKKNEALLLQKNRELEQAIAELRGDISRRSKGSSSEAIRCLNSASVTYQEIDEKPHEKFMPKRLQLYASALDDSRQLLRSGLYEAAAAVAVSAKSGLERLGFTIDDKAEEWDRQFDLFSRKQKFLKSRLHQEIADWETFTGNPSAGNAQRRAANVAEINFWCRGEWEGMSQLQKQYAAVVSDYSRDGREAYLKRPYSPSAEDLKKFTDEIDDALRRLDELSVLCRSRYAASCQRAEWGEEIIDFLTSEINLEWIEALTGFREASPEVIASGDFSDYVKNRYGDSDVTEDMREWLKLVFENASGSRIYIYILPIEARGHVTNRVILHIDYGGPEQELYSRDIFTHICEAIQLTDGNDGIVNYAADVNELKVSGNKAYSETGKDLERMKQHG